MKSETEQQSISEPIHNYICINPKQGYLNRARPRTRPRPRYLKGLKSFEDEDEYEDEHETSNEVMGNRIDLVQFLFR